MANLTDYIEDYLKKLIALSSDRQIEIRRRELAGKFSCVPSQINYVLERRFTPERGYLVESRRGGGGWIRIYRVGSDQIKTWPDLFSYLHSCQFEPEKISQILKRLAEEKIISRREAALLKAVTAAEPFREAGLNDGQAERLQRKLFSSALRELMKAVH